MKVKVKRKAKTSWHTDWEQEIKSAAIFAAEQLNIAHKKATVEFRLKDDSASQYAGVQLSLSPLKRSVIILNAAYLSSPKHILSTVMHEMTHVAQEFHNGLVMDDTTEAHYDGMVYSFDSHEHFQEAYWNLPWEVEARKMEKKLLKKYKKRLTF